MIAAEIMSLMGAAVLGSILLDWWVRESRIIWWKSWALFIFMDVLLLYILWNILEVV